MSERPLAPLSGPRGQTMFIPIPADASGVQTENRYADPEMWGKRYHEYEVGPLGTGVAIGDYDGDGLPDIFVVSKTESCHLFHNLGHWKFEDVTERAGVGDSGAAAMIWKQGVTFADVNNDGRLDIYVCRFGAPNLLYINQGDGTFKEMGHAYGLDVSDSSNMASFCDYDRDGWLDVFIQTNLFNNSEHPAGQHDYLFHNNRDGTFTNVTDRAGVSPTETQGHSATWWDFDNDGWPDLYVSNDFAVPDFLFHNNRDGTFTNVANLYLPHMPYSSMGSDIGDVNNDGLIDFMAAEMAASTHEKDQRGMALTRARDKDAGDDATSALQYLHNALYINTGVGRCLEAAFLAGLNATDWTWSIRFEDLDNDGKLDLHVTNGMHREAHNADLILRTMTAESATERVRIVRASPVLTESNFAFRNLGDLNFENVSAAWGLDQKGVSFGAAFGDLDGDGDLDLVYTNFQAPATLLRNDCESGHRLLIDLRGTRSNRYGVGAIVRIESPQTGHQIRQLFLARGYMSSSEPVVHFGLGADSVVTRLTITWPSGQLQTFENLPADRRYLITEPSSETVAVIPSDPVSPPQFAEVGQAINLTWQSREDHIDELAHQPLLPIRSNRRGPGLAVADINGDGFDDIVIGGTTKDPARVLLGSASGQFTEDTSAALQTVGPIDDGPVLLFDADGDGSPDLLITRGGNSLPAGSSEYQPVLRLNDGHGKFREAPADLLPPLSINAGAVVAGDFDRTGRLSIFMGARLQAGEYPQTPQSALLANRGGKFEDVTDRIAPGLREIGMVTAALWTDVDGDGWLDLLLTVEWGTVKYFHNHEGKSFEDWTERAGFASAGTGWWTSLAAADFNGDGRPDYVAGNVGLNTQYRATAEHPAVLYYGDFSGRGTFQQIEALYENNKLYPWRTRKDLSAAIPSILTRFPRNNAYAHATLNEILGEDKLATAQRFAATELRSGIFLSQPDGTFRFEPLPRIAQIAPLQGIVVGDFDGDGQADIYAVQNSYAPAPVVGRFDGGLSQLLHGDGHGHFAPVPLTESRLIVSGNAKALVTLDLNGDGWPDFVATRNNSTTLAFQNNGVPARHSLRVVLRSVPGNPTAVGARVTLVAAAGGTQTSEVYAGSGYYGQSTSGCFFGYTDSNRPKKLSVRWPTGRITEHEVPFNLATLSIEDPAIGAIPSPH